jgi:hypothetical protein
MKTYAIIELAGYDGENVRATGLSFLAACKKLERLYPNADEREELHVDIAREDADGYSYDY